VKRAIGLIFATALAALSQQPRIENTRLDTRPVAGSLESTMRGFVGAQASAAWIGYAVPIVAGQRQVCGWEGGNRSSTHMSLEGPSTLFVLYRVEQKAVVKVRMATPDCDIDAGGAPVTWLTGVNSAESVRYLETLVTPDRTGDSAVSAIALHNDPAADKALDALVAPNQPESVRRKAVFWLGVARGRHGYEKLLDVLQNDASDKVREHAIFALSQSKDKDAIPAIIRVARDDKSTHVRGQALFWLAQSAQKKLAADAIANAIENDPETDVKKKAVFALSQLPNGEGVTKLIDVAKTNRNTAVRKQALFWLGQSKDPRALKFIEDVLVR
jgi:HEAT repeats